MQLKFLLAIIRDGRLLILKIREACKEVKRDLVGASCRKVCRVTLFVALQN